VVIIMVLQWKAEYGVEAAGVRWHIAPESTGEALCEVWLSPIAWTRLLADLSVLRAESDEICLVCLACHRAQGSRTDVSLQEAR
jgi:hypothetical protein